jgi:hypothetical protein
VKVKHEIEVSACDLPGCDGKNLVQTCLSCGVMHCWEHAFHQPTYGPPMDLHGVEYHGNVLGGSISSGYYCQPCDARLSREKSDALHVAYQHIEALRTRYAEEHARFALDTARAEAEVTKERERRGLR